MTASRQQLEEGITALEAQRGALGDLVVDAALAGLRASLKALDGAQALRPVSILFLDIVGSTALTQRLDPESVHAVMDGMLERCTRVVVAHHGKVLQYAGDNLLAAFGADEAMEDDAERAVRCGLALLAEGRAGGERVLREYGHAGFDVRVGVHSGRVLLGGGVDADGTVRGIAVNIAARMEQTAPPGSLRISHDTFVLVRGRFDVQAQPPAPVKGVSDPIPTYLVERARPRSFDAPMRGIEGLATPLVGREAELQALQAAWRRAQASRRVERVLLVGDAGLGKSRLLREFEAAGAAPGAVLRGRAQPFTQGQVFGLLREVLAGWLGVADEDTPDVVRQRLAAAVAAHGGDAADAALIGHLVGLGGGDDPRLAALRDDARQLREQALRAVVRLLAALQRQAAQPLRLLLEDLHWADDATLDFVDQLAARHADLPLLVVGLTRPTLFDRRPQPPGATCIALAPLPAAAGRAMAEALLAPLEPQAAGRDGLVALLVERAAGNPFFLEELVKMLIDRGAIDCSARPWSLRGERLALDAVPLTLAGVLQARLDSLPGAERAALQDASVVGPVFWDQALAAVSGPAASHLPALVRRALTLPREAQPEAGWREYAFSHHLLHQVTYDTVLRQRRLALHGQVARWLVAQAGRTAQEPWAEAAEHFERAGEPAEAAACWAQAAERAEARLVPATALEQAERALALLDRVPAAAQDRLSWTLLRLRWRALDLGGRHDALEGCADEMAALAERLDDDACRAEVLTLRAIRSQVRGDWLDAEAQTRRSGELARRAGATELALRARQRLSVALRYLGRFDEALVEAEEGLAEARALGLRAPEVFLLNALSNLAEERQELQQSLRLRREGLALARALGNRRSEAVALGNLGNVLRLLGFWDEAGTHTEEAVGLMRAAGDLAMLCGPLSVLAEIRRGQGDLDAARALALEALEAARSIQARSREQVALQCVGHAELDAGRHDAAQAAYLSSFELAQLMGDGTCLDSAACLADTALARGDLPGAQRWVELILSTLDGGGGSLDGCEAWRVRNSCVQVLCRAGDPRAAAYTEDVHAALQAQAGRFDDTALRERFLTEVPAPRAIVAAWAALQPLSPDAAPTG